MSSLRAIAVTSGAGRNGHAGRCGAAALLLALASWIHPGLAQTPAVPTTKAAVAPPKPALAQPAKTFWNELSATQKQALAPLSADWETLERQRKLKWLEVANRYPGMKPEEQQRSQERMREWTRLTPEQRRVARDTYARVQTLPPEKRAELLEKYQNLPEEKKRQLEAESKSTKSLTPVKPPSKQLPPQPTPNNAQIRQGVALGMPKPPAPSAGAVPVQPAPATSVPEDAAPVSADNTPAKS